MTQNNFTATGVRDFATAGNWSLGHVPISSEDAEIAPALGAVVSSTAAETVNSIGLGANDFLNIQAATFDTNNGTGSNENSGTITIGGTATFDILDGTFDNPGTIKLTGSGSGNAAVLAAGSIVTLDGGGAIEMTIGGGLKANAIESDSSFTTPELNNVDNIISGDGTIGGGLDFTNDGTIETNNSTSSHGGTIDIGLATDPPMAPFGSFFNGGTGTVRADDGGTLVFGQDGVGETFTNQGAIDVASTGDLTRLEIAGSVTIEGFLGGGTINLGGSGAQSGDEIVSDGKAASLTIVKQTLKGAGLVGDSNLAIDNESGTINADISGEFLFLGGLSGAPMLFNGGTLEATGGGILIASTTPIANTGTIEAASGGIVALGSVLSTGAIDIGANSAVELFSTMIGNISFTGAGARLYIENSLTISGEILGAVPSDTIDVTASVASYSVSNYLTWQPGSSGGVLSLISSSGQTIESFDIAGSFRLANFTMTADGPAGPAQGTLITVTTPPPPTRNDFNGDGISDILWRNSSDDSLVTWLMNGAAVSSGTYVTYQGNTIAPDSSWSVAGIGDFNGDDDADVLWRQSTTGALVDWSMNGSVIESDPNVTYQGNTITPDSSWSVAGIGDFNGDGDADILWRQSTTGSLVDWSMSGAVVEAAGNLTYQGNAIVPDSSWSVAGIGDFNGDGKADILWRQSTTGTLVDWTMNGAVVQADANLTYQGNTITPDSSWSVVGIGDFNGDGKADILWRQSGTESLVEWQMNGSTVSSSAYVTSQGNAVAPDSTWSIVEVGNFKSGGPASILWQQSTTGSLVEWQMNGSQIASSNFVTSQGNPIAPPSNFQVQSNPTNFA